MTCILGMLKDGVVYMTGDHIATDGSDRTNQIRSKVFVNGEFLIGYTSSFRMGQLLQYVWEPPKRQRALRDDMTYMVKQVVPSIIKLFDDNKFLMSITESDGSRSSTSPACGGQFLVGYNGHLYRIESDFSCLESTRTYDAVGAGTDYALGAFASRLLWVGAKELQPGMLLRHVLHCVEEHCAMVSVDWDNFKVYKK